jgi:hypothetical protein
MTHQTCNHHECSEIGNLICQSCEKVYCEIHLKKRDEMASSHNGRISVSICDTCTLTSIVIGVFVALFVLLLLLVSYNQG